MAFPKLSLDSKYLKILLSNVRAFVVLRHPSEGEYGRRVKITQTRQKHVRLKEVFSSILSLRKGGWGTTVPQ